MFANLTSIWISHQKRVGAFRKWDGKNWENDSLGWRRWVGRFFCRWSSCSTSSGNRRLVFFAKVFFSTETETMIQQPKSSWSVCFFSLRVSGPLFEWEDILSYIPLKSSHNVLPIIINSWIISHRNESKSQNPKRWLSKGLKETWETNMFFHFDSLK